MGVGAVALSLGRNSLCPLLLLLCVLPSDGVFDLFHMGHARMLEQAKKSLGSPAKVYLLAGVCSDEDVHRYKGKTVMDHKIRCDSVSHCKWVDEVLSDAPWVIDDSYLAKHQIDFVAHDAIPYQDNSGVANDSSDVYAHVKNKGMFLETQRTEGLSTSDIIVKIIRDYDEYVIRNLDRGQSHSAARLPLSHLLPPCAMSRRLLTPALFRANADILLLLASLLRLHEEGFEHRPVVGGACKDPRERKEGERLSHENTKQRQGDTGRRTRIHLGIQPQGQN